MSDEFSMADRPFKPDPFVGPRYDIEEVSLGDCDTIMFRRRFGDKVMFFVSMKTPHTRSVMVSEIITTYDRRHNAFFGRTPGV